MELHDDMRIVLNVLCAAVLAFGVAAADSKSKGLKETLAATDTVVWAGLDYSLVRMIGPGDFANPDTIFPGMLESWNQLFEKEMIVKLNQALGRRIAIDTGGVLKRNQKATAKQIIPTSGPEDTVDKTHIAPDDIAGAVKAYKLETKEGLGLVFLVDRLVKPSQNGAVYIVYFDIKSRAVISSERVVHRATGFGFRNYWFRVVKDAVRDVKR